MATFWPLFGHFLATFCQKMAKKWPLFGHFLPKNGHFLPLFVTEYAMDKT